MEGPPVGEIHKTPVVLPAKKARADITVPAEIKPEFWVKPEETHSAAPNRLTTLPLGEVDAHTRAEAAHQLVGNAKDTSTLQQIIDQLKYPAHEADTEPRHRLIRSVKDRCMSLVGTGDLTLAEGYAMLGNLANGRSSGDRHTPSAMPDVYDGLKSLSAKTTDFSQVPDEAIAAIIPHMNEVANMEGSLFAVIGKLPAERGLALLDAAASRITADITKRKFPGLYNYQHILPAYNALLSGIPREDTKRYAEATKTGKRILEKMGEIPDIEGADERIGQQLSGLLTNHPNHYDQALPLLDKILRYQHETVIGIAEILVEKNDPDSALFHLVHTAKKIQKLATDFRDPWHSAARAAEPLLHTLYTTLHAVHPDKRRHRAGTSGADIMHLLNDIPYYRLSRESAGRQGRFLGMILADFPATDTRKAAELIDNLTVRNPDAGLAASEYVSISDPVRGLQHLSRTMDVILTPHEPPVSTDDMVRHATRALDDINTFMEDAKRKTPPPRHIHQDMGGMLASIATIPLRDTLPTTSDMLAANIVTLIKNHPGILPYAQPLVSSFVEARGQRNIGLFQEAAVALTRDGHGRQAEMLARIILTGGKEAPESVGPAGNRERASAVREATAASLEPILREIAGAPTELDGNTLTELLVKFPVNDVINHDHIVSMLRALPRETVAQAIIESVATLDTYDPAKHGETLQRLPDRTLVLIREIVWDAPQEEKGAFMTAVAPAFEHLATYPYEESEVMNTNNDSIEHVVREYRHIQRGFPEGWRHMNSLLATIVRYENRETFTDLFDTTHAVAKHGPMEALAYLNQLSGAIAAHDKEPTSRHRNSLQVNHLVFLVGQYAEKIDMGKTPGAEDTLRSIADHLTGLDYRNLGNGFEREELQWAIDRTLSRAPGTKPFLEPLRNTIAPPEKA